MRKRCVVKLKTSKYRPVRPRTACWAQWRATRSPGSAGFWRCSPWTRASPDPGTLCLPCSGLQREHFLGSPAARSWAPARWKRHEEARAPRFPPSHLWAGCQHNHTLLIFLYVTQTDGTHHGQQTEICREVLAAERLSGGRCPTLVVKWGGGSYLS